MEEFYKEDRDRAEREALRRYAEIANDEIGELCMILLDLCDRRDYISEDLYKAIMDEVYQHLLYFNKNFDVVKHEETYTQVWNELEFKGGVEWKK